MSDGGLKAKQVRQQKRPRGGGRRGGGQRGAYLRAHEDETKHVHRPHQGVQDEAVPALVGLVEQGVHRVASEQRVQHIAQVPNSVGIVLLGLRGIVIACKAHHEVHLIGLTRLIEPFCYCYCAAGCCKVHQSKSLPVHSSPVTPYQIGEIYNPKTPRKVKRPLSGRAGRVRMGISLTHEIWDADCCLDLGQPSRAYPMLTSKTGMTRGGMNARTSHFPKHGSHARCLQSLWLS